MGQYHRPINPAKCEFLHAPNLNTGQKMVEMLFSQARVNAALAALVSVQPGNAPADLANAWGVGRWAGDRLFMVGDYTEETDLPDWQGLPLNELFDACDARLLPPQEGPRDPEAFYNIAPAMRGAIEQGCSVRFVAWSEPLTMQDQDGVPETLNFERTELVPVKALARHNPETGAPAFVFDDGIDARGRQFLARQGITEETIDRPPQNGSWASLTNDEIDAGQECLLASLDAREYIDPAAFGDVPTTAGIMRGDSSAALLLALFVPAYRGGGDVDPRRCPSLGRWRNQRIIASAEIQGDFPTTDEIRGSDDWTDVSQEMIRDLAAADR